MAGPEIIIPPELKLQKVHSFLSREDPEKAAKVRRISADTGVPEPVVRHNPDNFEGRRKVPDFRKLREEAPATARRLQNPSTMAVAHDDVENLGTLEKFARAIEPIQNDPAMLGISTALRSYLTAKDGEAPSRSVLQDVLSGTMAGGVQFNEMMWRVVRAATGQGDESIAYLEGLQESPMLQASRETEGEGLEAEIRRSIFEGSRSIPPSVLAGLPGMAVAGVATRAVPSLQWAGKILGFAASGGTVFGVAEYDSFLQEVEEAGLDPEEYKREALLSAIAEGGFEGLSDLIALGLTKAGKPLTEPIKNKLLQYAKNYAIVALSEVPSEMMTAAVQSVIRESVGLPTLSPGESAMKALGPSLVASLGFAGIVQGTRQTPQHDPVPDLIDAITKAKLTERSPQEVEALLKEVTTENVFVDAKDFDVLFQEGVDGESMRNALLEELDIDQTEYQEAVAMDGILEIPVAKLPHLIRNERGKQVTPKLRAMPMREDEITDTDRESTLARNVSILGQTLRAVESQQPTPYRDKVAKSMMETGRVTQEEANANAALVDAMARTWERNTGQLAEEYYKLRGFLFQASEFERVDRQEELTQAAMEPPKSPRGSTKIINDGTAIVSFFKAKDLSTAPHEIAHVFRRDLELMAEHPRSPVQVKRDWDAVRSWLGAEEGRPLTRDQEEKWAKGFEAYLMEGKAPSVELQTTFHRFRDWLLSIYKSLKGLGVEISQDMSGVFDRLLASEDEINQIREVMSMEPLFDRDDGSGLLGAREWDKYERVAAKARASASEVVAVRRQKELRKLRSGWKKEAKTLADETAGHQVIDRVVNAGGISRESLVAAGYAQDAISEMIRKRIGLVTEGGTPLDELGMELGFDYPDDLVELFLTTPTKKVLQEQYLKQLEAEWEQTWKVDEEILTEQYVELLEEESKALAKQTKGYKPPTNRELARIVKEQTGQVRNEKLVKESTALRSAMRKAAQASRKAYRAGKYDEALREKEKQRMLAVRRRERIQGREEQKKAIKYFKRVLKAKNLDADYLEAIQGLLAPYELKGRSGKTQAKFDKITKIVDAAKEAGEFVDIPEKLIERAKTTSIKDLTLDELRELRENVEHLEHLGKLKKRLIGAKQGRDYEQVMGEIGTEVAGAWGLDLESMTRVDDGEFSLPSSREKSKMRGELSRMRAELRKVEFIIDHLSGFKGMESALYRNTFHRMYEAENNYFALLESLGRPVQQAFNNLPKQPQEKVKIDSVPGMWTQQERVMFALNSGNRGNYSALVNGNWAMKGKEFRLEEPQVRAVLDTLTSKEWSFVQEIWQSIEVLWPGLKQAYQQMTGKKLPKVEPWKVKTKFGEIEGGYFPLTFDRELSQTVAAFSLEKQADFFKEQIYAKPKAKADAAHARKGGAHAPLLDFGVIFGHIDKTARYVTHATAIRDVNKITSDKRFKRLVEEVMGENVYRQFRPWLQHIAQPKIPLRSGWEGIFRRMRHGTTAQMLGASMTVFMAQPMSLPGGIMQMQKDGYGVGKVGFDTSVEAAKIMAELIIHPGGGGKTISWVHAMSSQMRNRRKTWNRELNELRADASTFGLASKQKKFLEYAFMLIKLGDMMGAYPVWVSAYKQAEAKYGDTARAVEYADKVVRMTQPVASPKDLSLMQHKSELNKQLTMFYTYFSVYQNQLESLQPRYMTKGNMEPEKFLMAYALLVVLPGVVITQLRSLYREGELAGPKDTAIGVLSLFLGGIPLLREYTSYLQGYGVGIPTFTAFEKTFQASRDIVSVVTPNKRQREKALKRIPRSLADAAGYWIGLPTTRIYNVGENVIKAIEGEDVAPLKILERQN